MSPVGKGLMYIAALAAALTGPVLRIFFEPVWWGYGISIAGVACLFLLERR